MSNQFPEGDRPEEPSAPDFQAQPPVSSDQAYPYGSPNQAQASEVPPPDQPGSAYPYGAAPGAPQPSYGQGQIPPNAPPPGQYPTQNAPQMPYPQQPQQPAAAPTDGMAIAALVTGILGLGIVPLILGIVSLKRIKQTQAGGRGLAIAGIVLGALELIFWIIMLIIFVIAAVAVSNSPTTVSYSSTSSSSSSSSVAPNYDFNQTKIDQELTADPALRTPYEQCSNGNMAACDELFMRSDFGSELEKFGDSCGGKGRTTMFCDQ